MILLDENINEHQCLLLRSWRLRPRLIGRDIAQKGIQDEQIVPLLHRLLRHPQFNTRAKRMGRVVRVSSAGIQYWGRHSREEHFVAWEV